MNQPPWVRRLSDRLSEPLPGTTAQQIMGPRGRLPDGYREVPPNARRGAVLIALLGDTVPFILRGDTAPHHRGQIAFPGGRFEPPDRNQRDTALREAHEEIALPPDRMLVLGTLSPLYVHTSNYSILPVAAWADPELNLAANLTPQPLEVTRILFGKPHEIASTISERTVTGYERLGPVPTFLVEDEIVWGATAMMLCEFLVCLADIGVLSAEACYAHARKE